MPHVDNRRAAAKACKRSGGRRWRAGWCDGRGEGEEAAWCDQERRPRRASAAGRGARAAINSQAVAARAFNALRRVDKCGDATRAPFPWYGGKRRWADLDMVEARQSRRLRRTVRRLAGRPSTSSPALPTRDCVRPGRAAMQFLARLAGRPRSRGLLGGVADDPPRPHRAAHVAATVARGAWWEGRDRSRLLRREGRGLVGLGIVELDRGRVVCGWEAAVGKTVCLGTDANGDCQVEAAAKASRRSGAGRGSGRTSKQ